MGMLLTGITAVATPGGPAVKAGAAGFVFGQTVLGPQVEKKLEERHVIIKEEQEKKSEALNKILNTPGTKENPVFGQGGAITAPEKGTGLYKMFRDSYTPPSMFTKPKEYAFGGILDRPHLGLVAEAGPEAIIPLTKPSRALQLWNEVGERMGFSRMGQTAVSDVAVPPPAGNRLSDTVLNNIPMFANGGFINTPH
ncbi:hypothetical protein U6N72_12730, partial [Cutibacterium acnes]